jgi:heme/copper-type cytochrome/quinol oxidase subunit 2
LANIGTIVVPSAPFISTTRMNICNGESVVLTATGCNETIVWNNGTTSSAITISQIGTYSAQCQNQCSKSNQSNVITIQQGLSPVAPIISTTKTVLCDGEFATLTASGCLGIVLWSTGSTTNSIQLIVSGTYTAVCRNQCGESMPSNSIVLRASSLPTFPTISSNKTSICNNETATLVATNCNGNLLWNNGMTTSTIQVSQAATYTVTCNNICGATGSQPFVLSNSSSVVAPPTITTNKASICNAEIATLSATGCFGNVVWSNGSTGISTQISKSGTYTALCENFCGISANSNSLTISQLSSQCTPISIKKVK